MRRSRLATIASLLGLAVLLVSLCPCPSGTMAAATAEGGGEHDCCAPPSGIRAAVPSCCTDDAAARPRVSTTSPPPASVARAPVIAMALPVAALRGSAPTAVRLTVERPPLVLRI